MSLPETRAEARTSGLKFFFTGVVCEQGHIARRYTSTGGCVECTYGYHTKYQQQIPDYKSKSTRRSRKRKVETNYGLSIEQYHNMMDAAVSCPICKTPLSNSSNMQMSRAVMDHNHLTKTARAVICARCNLGLGSFDDDPALLRTAANYIEKHNGRIHN